MPYGDLTGSRAGQGARGGYGSGDTKTGSSYTGRNQKPRTRRFHHDTFLARYPGKCRECGQAIRVGDIITRAPAHSTCPQ